MDGLKANSSGVTSLHLDKGVCNLLKFVSAIIVALHHYSQHIISHGETSNIIYQLFSTQGGYLGVAIFFFLSGYGLFESEQKQHLNIKEFIKRRFFKVLWPVIFVTIIWAIWSIYIIELHSVSWTKIIMNFGDDILWFIKVLILLYIVFFIFSVINQISSQKANIFLLISTVILYFIVKHAYADFMAVSVPLFSVGVLSSKYKIISSRRVWLSPVVICILGCVFVIIDLLLIKTNKHIGFSLGLHACVNYVFIAFIILVFSRRKINVSFPEIIGIISFDIYLIHNKVLMSLAGNNDRPVGILLFFILTSVIAIFCYNFRTKVMKFIQKLYC